MEKMPKPQTEAQFFLHQCDFISSRRNIIVKDIKYDPNDFIINEAAAVVDEIITLCKEKVANGCDRELLKQAIANNNNGNPDPRKIHTIYDGTIILELIKQI